MNEAPQNTPSAPAAESTYLAALLAGKISPGALFLDPDEFTQDRHEFIYSRASRRLLNDEPFAVSLIVEELSNDGDLALVGGAQYLALLENQGQNLAPGVVDEAGRLIRQNSTLAKLQSMAADVATARPDGLEKLLSKFSEGINDLSSRLNSGAPVRYSTDADLDAILGNIEWLWDKWILNGFVTAVVARQETGKSNLSLDLCGRLLTGAAWPDGNATGIAPDCRLLWIDTEMALGAMVQRLNDWGLPRGRFILPEDPLQLLQLDKDADWRWIEGAVAKFRPPLIVIDALSGAHRSEEKDNDAMKVILQRLSMLAQQNKCAVVIIHHIRKAGVGEPNYPISLDSVRGASAITQFCRSVLALGVPDKTQPDLRRLDSIKSNFARKPEPLGYQITDSGLAWGDAPEVPKSANPIEGARAFLLDFLGKGRRPSSDVFEAAEVEGLSSSTIKRASKELNVKAVKDRGRDGRWFWALPGKKFSLELVEDAQEA